MLISSLLFVPGNDERKIQKAFASPAAAVCLDLEDAVAANEKRQAREITCKAMQEHVDESPLRLVRVNPSCSNHFEADMGAVVKAGADGVLIPMAETPDDISMTIESIGCYEKKQGKTIQLIPIIESARGVVNCFEILTASDRIASVLFGPADFALSMRVTLTPDETQVLHARGQVAIAARAAEIEAIDGPFVFLSDHDSFKQSVKRGALLGYSGKAVIHPKQLAHCLKIFQVSSDDIRWARRVDEAFSRAEAEGVASIELPDGSFVDYAIVKRARQILKAASSDQRDG